MTALLLALLAAASDRPNIVLIVADDLGYGDLGCFGAADMRTPHLDNLAATGQRWTRFYANCPVCSPTRAALLTGRYQDLVGVPGVIRTHEQNNWGDLADDAITLPGRLQAAGYRTACIGKWHLGLERPDHPLDRGFDRFHGFLGDMMDDYETHRRHDINYMRRGTETIDPEGHATDLFSDWAIETIDQWSDGEQPFFLYLAYNAPHVPIQPPEDWRQRVRERQPDASDKRVGLVALIEHMDDGIGRVLAALDERQLADSTVVIFTSDNGGQVNVGATNGPHRGTKGEVYEGGLIVPTIVRAPGVTSPGSETDQLAMSMDLAPTIAELAGTAFENPIDGVSVGPTLRGEEQGELRPHHVFRRREGGTRYNGQTINAVRRGRWKLVQNSPFSGFELYDLQTDPREQTDVFGTAPKPVRRDLMDRLSEHRQRCGAIPWQRPQVAIDGVEPR